MKTMHRTALSFVALFLGSLGLAAAQDKVTIPLTDPSQPVTLKASLLTGSITVKASAVKNILVEARVRDHDAGEESGGRHRIAINTTGLSAEEEDNVVEIGAETSQRAVDLDITVPVRTS